MTLIASDWLAICAVLCLFAWFANRRFIAFSLPLAVALAALSVYIPTGTARYTSPPPGRYTVLGARIDVNGAIYALLDDGKGAPTFYKLPYSASSASHLQNALDGAQNGQGVEAQIDGEGGASFDGEPPVHGDEPKVPEAPALSLP